MTTTPGVSQYCAAKACMLALSRASRADTKQPSERERQLKARVRAAMQADGVTCVDTHASLDADADAASPRNTLLRRYVVLKPSGSLPLDEDAVIQAWKTVSTAPPPRAARVHKGGGETVGRVLAKAVAAQLRARDKAFRASSGRTTLLATQHKPRAEGASDDSHGQQGDGKVQHLPRPERAPSRALLLLAREYAAASEALREARKPWREKQAPHRETCREAEPTVVETLRKTGGGAHEVQVRRRTPAPLAAPRATAEEGDPETEGKPAATASAAAAADDDDGEATPEHPPAAAAPVAASVSGGLIDALARAGVRGERGHEVESFTMKCETKTRRPRVGTRAVVDAVEDAVSQYYATTTTHLPDAASPSPSSSSSPLACNAYTDAFAWTPGLVAHVEASLREWYRNATRETERTQVCFRPSRHGTA